MKKDSGVVFRVFLMLSDALAIVLSFMFAYFLRIYVDQRPFYFEVAPWDFVLSICLLVPVWLIILACLGLYQKAIFTGSKGKEIGRLFIASVIGLMAIITYDFFAQGNLFPVRVMALWALVFCFVFLCLMRMLLRAIRKRVIRSSSGSMKAVIVGNHPNTDYLANYIAGFPECGYQVVGVVANGKYVPKGMKRKHYSSLKEALRKCDADVIFQTDEMSREYVYRQSVNRHLLYYFVPQSSALSSHFGQVELLGDTPVILVKVTPLSGAAKIVKRTMDLLIGGVATILALIPMMILWILIKISDWRAPAVYSSIRLSRYNQRVKIYKFRSMKREYSGMTPEEAFVKMGKPELIKKYRKNGDFLANDPRVTKIGKFIRATSLDELPQLFNVLKGDISLVGPRALVPGELRNYGDRSLLLSVKSGLTGLAQVSGRRDISFEERRSLDIYYIQNWSVFLDISILFRTIGAVLFRRGAK